MNFILTLVGALLGPKVILANGIFEVQHQNKVIYEVVFASGTDETALAPGIYVPEGANKSVPVILGNVDGASRRASGILAFLAIGISSKTHEAIAVVDGKLVMFNIHSRKARRGSVIVFGSKENPLVDVINQRPLELAPIASKSDLYVFQKNEVHFREERQAVREQVVLISFKQKNMLGDGFTFALVLSSKNAVALRGNSIVSGLHILDYSYYSPAIAEVITQAGTTHEELVAPLIVHAKARANLGSHPVNKKWQENLVKFETLLRAKTLTKAQGALYESLEQHVPLYNLKTRGVSYARYPFLIAKESGDIFFVQRVNPETAEGQLIVAEDGDFDDPAVKHAFSGFIDVDEKAQSKIYMSSHSPGQYPAFLFFSGQELYAAFGDHLASQKGFIKKIGFNQRELGNDIAFFHCKFQKEHFFLISQKKGKGGNGVTYLVRINTIGSEANVATRHKIADRFFNEAELRLRTQVINDRGAGHIALAFDNVTPPKPEKIYRQLSISTPFIDLTSVNGGDQIYRAPLRQIHLSDNLFFREYNLSHARAIRSGFYYFTDGGNKHAEYDDEEVSEEILSIDDYSDSAAPKADTNSHIFVPGQLLERPSEQKKKPKFYLDLAAPPEADKDKKNRDQPDLTVAVFPFKSKPFADSKDFELLVVADDDNDKYVPSIQSIKVNHPFANLAGAKIIFGRRVYSNTGMILLFLDRNKAKSADAKFKDGAVLAVQFAISYNNSASPRNITLSIREPVILENNLQNISNIGKRVVFDTNGTLFWIKTPDIDSRSNDYGVIDCFSPGKPKVVNPIRNSIVLRHNEDVFTAGDALNFADLFSQWTVTSPSDLVYNYPDLKKSQVFEYYDYSASWQRDEKKEKAEKPPEKQPEMAIAQDLGLIKYLNDVANPASAPTHDVILVEPGLKQELMTDILASLAKSPEGYWALRPRGGTNQVNFYAVPPSTPTREIARELLIINNHALGSGRRSKHVVFATLKDLISIDGPISAESRAKDDELPGENDSRKNDEDDDDEKPEKEDKRPSTALLFSTEGSVSRLSDYTGKASVNRNIQMVFLATPAEWRTYREAAAQEEESGVLSSFNVVTKFLTSDWTVWPPKNMLTPERIKQAKKVAVTDEEHQVFPNLSRILEDNANPHVRARHQILIVPEKLLPLVDRLILARWIKNSSEAPNNLWSSSNERLALNLTAPLVGDDESPAQEDLFDAYTSMHGSGKRSVLYGTLKDIIAIGRPESDSKNPYLIRDFGKSVQHDAIVTSSMRIYEDTDEVEGDDNAEDNSNTKDTEEPSKKTKKQNRRKVDESREQYPHALWFIANEGARVAPANYMPSDVNRAIPTLLIGSDREWQQLQNDADFECRFGVCENFDLVRLEEPTNDHKTALIRSLFNRRNIKLLGYEFMFSHPRSKSAKNQSAMDQLIALFVSRSDQYARQFGMDVTTGFIKTFVELTRTLIEDATLRRSRKIDEYFVENFFSRVFPITLNPAYLPPDDFLNKLVDEQAAADALARLGYSSTLELRKQFIHAVNAQTRGVQQGRNIPSSGIFYGPTGKGKTLLLLKLMTYLGLKPYNFSQPHADEAGYFHLSCQDITEGPSEGNLINIEQLKEHFLNFLAMPNGHRGFIFVDDLHKAQSTKILKDVMALIQSLFEAKNGMLRVKRLAKHRDEVTSVSEIPTRNLNLWVVVNPTKDREMIQKYIGKDDGESNIVDWVIASIARKDYPLEDSFVSRFGIIMNFSEFKPEAKAPALVAAVREYNQLEFPTQRSLTVAADHLITSIVNHSAHADARQFLGPATSSLMVKEPNLPEAPIYIASLSTDPTVDDDADDDRPHGTGKEEELERFIQQNRILRPVGPKFLDARIEFLKMIMNNFRLQIIRALTEQIQSHRTFVANQQAQAYMLTPAMIAIHTHILEHPHISLQELKIYPHDFPEYSSRDGREYLMSLITEASKDARNPYFPVSFGNYQDNGNNGIGRVLQDGADQGHVRTRRNVMADTTVTLEKQLMQLMAHYFRVGSVNQFPTAESWFRMEKNLNMVGILRDEGQRLVDHFTVFVRAFNDPTLIENMPESKRVNVPIDQRMRLFLYAIDKAIVTLPWSRGSDFFYKILETAVGDLNLGQDPAFQDYVFKHEFSPLSGTSNETLTQSLFSSGEYAVSRGQGMNEGVFAQKCGELFAP